MKELTENVLEFRLRSVKEINRTRKEHDFVKACMEVLKRPEVIVKRLSASEIVELALKMNAPDYYVSYSHASARIQAMMKHPHKRVDSEGKPLHQLWQEIFEKSSAILNSRRWISLDRAVAIVLERGNASSFFLSKSAAMRIFRKYFRRSEIYTSRA